MLEMLEFELLSFNLLLARPTNLLCFFFLFLVICKIFFIILVVKENARLKIRLDIPSKLQ